ncbi:probable serine hydrolase isoform X1 [Amphibalanus amphitrite]|uniref:probable serine hydrolase isoform X1 n=2 Tax=Amphibalanus amphitrite TaxID=1232801 RepID=UPI001C91E837|nr:probable serine hydrolase isoform X1 [Amphibalanus amphitrite]XP_043240389.1 probable serine hydrolase isoform X1 [Amphibalanus amphitrite]XP_043240390.1 probable serine hydrolase isoform X1 [Amphibalanus amphitrite]XP_043240392.1 probable serine hydrolase isoform X1 [Amphibalanus amphitrite]
MHYLFNGFYRLAPVRTLQIKTYIRRMSTIREIEIPVPWGHIAGRESGPADGRPLLMLHGWLDNCGTYEAIQTHLPPTYRCVNIDLPGHGRSSHLPPGPMIGSAIALGTYVVRMVRDHYGWSRFSIMGHSMGSGVGVLYAACFPEDVASLTILDLVKFITRPVEQHPANAREAVLSYLEVQRKMTTNERPQYTYEALQQRLISVLGGDVDATAADALLARGARRNPDTGLYESTYDLRLRTRTFQSMDFVGWREFASRLRCRLLLVLAEQGGTWISAEEEAEAIQTYRQAVPELRLERLPGGHHVHLTHPERVLPIINEFLTAEPDTAAVTTAAATGRSGL